MFVGRVGRTIGGICDSSCTIKTHIDIETEKVAPTTGVIADESTNIAIST